MRCLAIFWVVLLNVCAFGQEFNRGDIRDWADKRVQHLHDLKLWGSGLGHELPHTRYEYAVHAHDSFSSLTSIIAYLEKGDKDGEEAYKSVAGRERELSRAAGEVADLIRALRVELTKLGGDVPTLLKEVSTYPARLQRAVSEQLLADPTRIGAAPEWTVNAALNLKEFGFLVGYPDYGHRGVGPPSRYEVAVATYYILQNVRTYSDFELTLMKSIGTGAKGTEQARARLQAETWVGYELAGKSEAKLIAEFYPELIKLGADPDQMSTTLALSVSSILRSRVPEFGAFLSPFPDVTADHWAAKATRELRAAGILHGYPGGLFRGN
jgi:hypothetical protein